MLLNNSALLVDVVAVCCLEAFQSIRHDPLRKAVLKEFGDAERVKKKTPLREAFEDVYENITEAEEHMKELKRILETYSDEYDL
ncbi:2-oxoisovalerate dehydrogenase complex alpha subunit [Penicillium riverlandense]|uniref:2-oxoisovalerate dehydrogenase complex alpha subunit n=1 Tax=Penicillium riverlandense TaxID=1903569 RepID=UPI0025485368|nr:2-oxoisovalerate dehydrogenase complex alpha subunit [Penicillium riverlandense]KAJ5812671.1 2-oxoisovalerate dehydrogenase complex alpha subunit [Penicillium riverlandense]